MGEVAGLRYRLIALDLDGTLLSSRKEITPRTRAALRLARERGIITVVATGRTPRSARLWSRQIGGGPAICCNGAGVLDESGELMISTAIPKAPLLRVLELGATQRILTECYTKDQILLDRPWEQVVRYLEWVRPTMGSIGAWGSLIQLWQVNRMQPVRNLRRWAEQPSARPILKVMLLGETQRLQGLAQQLHRELPGLSITSSAPDNLEIMAAGVSKGVGLEMLGARLRIPREAMIAFGDSTNDLEMLRYAGLGVAMGNATPPVKAVAARTTATCDEDGVAQMIEELCKQ